MCSRRGPPPSSTTDVPAQAVGVAGGDAGDGGVGAGGGGVDDQPGQADRPLDRPLGDVDVLDPEVRDGRVDAPDDPVAQLQGVLGDLVAPVAVAGPGELPGGQPARDREQPGGQARRAGHVRPGQPGPEVDGQRQQGEHPVADRILDRPHDHDAAVELPGRGPAPGCLAQAGAGS
jgi:hypothetical protein